MTPAVNLLVKKKIAHKVLRYEHDENAVSYGLEAAEKLAQPVEKVFKTLVVEKDDGLLAVAIIPVSQQLNFKRMAKACNVKKVSMAKPDKVQRSTGYVLGGVSPLGQKKLLQTVVDSSAKEITEMLVSGGRRGLEIVLSPDELAKLTRAKFADLTND